MHDLTKDDNTMKYVRSSTKIIEEMEGDGDILVGFSEIIERGEITILVRILMKLMKDLKGFVIITVLSCR